MYLSPAAQGGDFGGSTSAEAGALEASNDDDLPFCEPGAQPVGAYIEDAGPAVGGFGNYPYLGSGH